MFYLYATAIIIGGFMAWQRLFRGQPYPSTGISLLHAIFAITGLVIMVITSINDNNRTTHFTNAMIVFLIAAIIGIVMFFAYHARKKAISTHVLIAHAVVALIAFIWLLV